MGDAGGPFHGLPSKSPNPRAGECGERPVLMQETSKPVEDFYEFILAEMMSITGEKNLNGWRKCSGEWQY